MKVLIMAAPPVFARLLMSSLLAVQGKSNYELWGFWANTVLVLATLIIAIFAIVQASAANRGAKAAILNAQAVISSERPWLLVDIERIVQHAPLGTPDFYRVRAFNTGGTPAELSEGHCSCKLQAAEGFVPPDDLHDPIKAPLKNLIVSGDGFDVAIVTPETAGSDDDLGGMAPKIVHVYGKLLYWDMFRDRKAKGVEPYVTQWDFTYNSSKREFFRTSGPYTKNT